MVGGGTNDYIMEIGLIFRCGPILGSVLHSHRLTVQGKDGLIDLWSWAFPTLSKGDHELLLINLFFSILLEASTLITMPMLGGSAPEAKTISDPGGHERDHLESRSKYHVTIESRVAVAAAAAAFQGCFAYDGGLG